MGWGWLGCRRRVVLLLVFVHGYNNCVCIVLPISGMLFVSVLAQGDVGFSPSLLPGLESPTFLTVPLLPLRADLLRCE